METFQVNQQMSVHHVIDVLSGFLFNLNKAHNGKQEVERTPMLFKTGERDKAIEALNAAESAIPTVLELLSEMSSVLVPLRQELESIQGGPENTPAGLPYDSLIPVKELSTRAFNCLVSGNVTTLRQFCALEEWDLMKFRNLGRKTYDELEAYRNRLGMPFKTK